MAKKLINLAKIDFAGNAGAGPGPTPSPSADADVVLRDYDGSVVASYTKEEFAALTELPAPPEHEGLTFQEWNWPLADAQAYCAQYGMVEIGATYITIDGKTRIYITLTEGRTSPTLGMAVNGSVDVDWGDNSTHNTLSGNTLTDIINTQHIYSAPGNYIISISPLEDTIIAFIGNTTYGSTLIWDSKTLLESTNKTYQNSIKKILIGKGVIEIGKSAFHYCYSLTSVSIPNNVESIGESSFQNCYHLCNVTIPKSITSIGNNAFRTCYGLTSVAIPKGVNYINNNVFYSCYRLTRLVIPQSVNGIGNSSCQYCYCLTRIIVPQGVTYIGSSVFQNCNSMAIFRFASIDPPVIQSNTFSSIPSDCIIYVPAESVEAYKTATNWTSQASKIQPMP